VLSTRGDRNEVLPILGLYAYAGLRLMPSISRVLGAMNAIRYASSATALVHEDVSRLESLSGDRERGSALQMLHLLRLDDVWFRYDGARFDALQAVSIDIGKGQLVAIVGESGAGKSTLVDLLLGLHAPQRGRVLVDGRDIAGAIGAWQAAIGYVPQSVFVLDESLRRNVAFGVGDAEIDDARVMQAIGRAQLDDAVAGLPEGLATRLGERGSRLSGGQRQRVGIARALYAGRKVLVLDEAMSAVDTLTERELNDTIERLRGEHTIILITHRMQLVRQCDVVVMMGGGRIIASGAFNDVYAGSAEFRTLYEAAGEAGSAKGVAP
jgi:ATP-binding cassette subfamily C protein